MIKKIAKKVASELDLSPEDVEKIYDYYWKYIYETLNNTTIPSSVTEEEFPNLFRSINIPAIGKIGCTYKRYKNKHKQLKYKTKHNGRK